MLVTQISNHVQAALDRLMQQYKGRPRIQALITALVQQIQDFEDAAFPVDEGRQLAHAEGVQLDGIGAIVGLQRNGLSDAAYLLFLYGKIAENTSDTTIQRILTIVALTFNPEEALLYEYFPAAIGIAMSGVTLDPIYYEIAGAIIQGALGAGIGLAYLEIFDTENAFTVGPSSTGGGFGDALNPAVGGKLAAIIYSNSPL